jgi:hypothetical protein
MTLAARRALRDPRHARAYRQRRYRARQRLGEGVYRVCVRPAVIEALLARSEADSRDRCRQGAGGGARSNGPSTGTQRRSLLFSAPRRGAGRIRAPDGEPFTLQVDVVPEPEYAGGIIIPHGANVDSCVPSFRPEAAAISAQRGACRFARSPQPWRCRNVCFAAQLPDARVAKIGGAAGGAYLMKQHTETVAAARARLEVAGAKLRRSGWVEPVEKRRCLIYKNAASDEQREAYREQLRRKHLKSKARALKILARDQLVYKTTTRPEPVALTMPEAKTMDGFDYIGFDALRFLE